MTERSRNRIVGLVLLGVSMLWCWGAWTTIPNTYSGPVGARGFPLALGVLLGILALTVFLGTFRPDPEDPKAEREDDKDGAIPLMAEIWAIGVPVVLLLVYVFLLWAIGFLLATATVVALGLIAINERRPAVLGGLVVGLSLGIYLIFGKVLGIYLPYGEYLNLAF